MGGVALFKTLRPALARRLLGKSNAVLHRDRNLAKLITHGGRVRKIRADLIREKI
jgi:hypothetical protein